MSDFISLWIDPSKVIQKYSEDDIFRFLPHLIFTLTSLSFFIEIIEFDQGWIYILPLSIITGVLIGKIYTLIIFSTGKIWQGQANYRQLFFLSSIAFSPYMITLVYQILGIIIKGSVPSENALLNWLLWIIHFRIMVVGLTDLQNFDRMKAVLNVLLPGLLVFVAQIIFWY